MINEYINAAMKCAHYELIEDEEPFYGEIPELSGVWGSGQTLEECRDNLFSSLEGWLLVRNRLGLDFSTINGLTVITPSIK